MSTYYADEKRQDQPCGRVAEGVMLKPRITRMKRIFGVPSV